MSKLEDMKKEIAEMKSEIKWIKKIGYYISGIMTLQLIAIIGGAFK